MALVAPSMLAADFTRLADEIASAEAAGAKFFHLDIMDGHFVPNLSFGPGITGQINRLTDGFLDVHLMLSEPERFFEPFVNAGADSITFHLEAHPQPAAQARRLRELAVQTGLSINPDMPIERALPHLEHFDYLLIMSVYPGFGGQKFIPSALPKVAEARRFIEAQGLSTQIQVDGGVDLTNAGQLIEAGADILVMGTAFFGAADRGALVREVARLSQQTIRSRH